MGICKFCYKELKNNGALTVHEKSCAQNPNRVVRKRAENAGAKKGTSPWNKGKKIGRAKHLDLKYTDDMIFCENSKYSRHALKKRILVRNLIEYVCACCGIGPEWMGKPMPLILDHINGVNNDNRLSNLRFVCSNCDSQLVTYKSRNRKNKENAGVGSPNGLENRGNT